MTVRSRLTVYFMDELLVAIDLSAAPDTRGTSLLIEFFLQRLSSPPSPFEQIGGEGVILRFVDVQCCAGVFK